MKEVSNITANDSVEAQSEVEHCGNVITKMLVSQPDHAHTTQMDADIVYYVDGFTSRSLKRAVAYVGCGDILEEGSALEITIEAMIPENFQFFVDKINRKGKLCDLIYAICTLAWDTYLQIIENSEAKSFLIIQNAPKCFAQYYTWTSN